MVRLISTSTARFSNQNFENLKRRVMVTPFQKYVFTTNRQEARARSRSRNRPMPTRFLLISANNNPKNRGCQYLEAVSKKLTPGGVWRRSRVLLRSYQPS